jgi:hypothetical protein
MLLGIVATLSLIGGSVEAKAAGCEAIGNFRFICDQLALLWQIFGRNAAAGDSRIGFSVIHRRSAFGGAGHEWELAS